MSILDNPIQYTYSGNSPTNLSGKTIIYWAPHLIYTLLQWRSQKSSVKDQCQNSPMHHLEATGKGKKEEDPQSCRKKTSEICCENSMKNHS